MANPNPNPSPDSRIILSVFLLFSTLPLSPSPNPSPNPRVPSPGPQPSTVLSYFPTPALSPRLAALSPSPSPNRLSPAQQSNCFLRPQWRTRASRASIAMMMRRGERERGRQIEKMLTVVGVHDTDEASRKHTNTLKTVDREA